MIFKTPILFIIFNRPDTTHLVFESIRKLKPKYLFVAADGPRLDKQEDIEKCKKVRSIIKVDWECKVQTLYSKQNLGCGIGPSSAISWFFDHVNEGIILEDDCLPHPEFYNFCEDLLKKYRSNPLISSISGTNFQNGRKRGNGSYYFSVHNRIWGWATWKRTWEKYDYYLKNIDDKESQYIVQNLFKKKDEHAYWLKVFNNSKKTQTNNSAWDFQFMFLQWKIGSLTITPNVNLVSNIGYGLDATHTSWGKNNPNLNRQIGPIFPLIHPNKIEREWKADEYYFSKFIKPKSNFTYRLIRRISKLFYLRK